ncbi:MAG: hypothetical protein GWP91_24330, partial [Rhodobacterales bacterium]|nr:hypothetical protein [Rhodobacterales bacterium]
LLAMSFPGALPFPIHHDVIRKSGRTYVLFAEEVLGLDQLKYVLDGVLILDDQGVELGRIRLADHVAPTGGGQLGGFWNAHYPEAVDFTHSNGLFIDDEGNLLWSLRLQNTVLKFAADPDRPDFGELLWSANGDGSGAFGNDFSFANDTTLLEAGFERQHHPNLDDQGRLLLFDNREGLLDPSRVTVWQINEEQSSFTLQEAWELPAHCLFQGSAFPLPNGNVLATCSTTETLYEFAPGVVEPVASLNVPCDAAAGTLMVRGQPLQFTDLNAQ